MRKVTLGLANSLDNYIARKDGGSDWLHWSKEVAEISSKFLKTVDAILIGRKTYEVMLGFGQTSYPGAKNYVFSFIGDSLASRPPPPRRAGAPARVALSFIPLFHEMKKQIDLEFLDCKILKGGYLVVTYRVKH